jgi:hypothetical protein
MEDHKWEDAATEWQKNYLRVKAELDALESKMSKIRKISESIRRGCDCEYDYRCGNCEQILQLHNVLEEITR